MRWWLSFWKFRILDQNVDSLLSKLQIKCHMINSWIVLQMKRMSRGKKCRLTIRMTLYLVSWFSLKEKEVVVVAVVSCSFLQMPVSCSRIKRRENSADTEREWKKEGRQSKKKEENPKSKAQGKKKRMREREIVKGIWVKRLGPRVDCISVQTYRHHTSLLDF